MKHLQIEFERSVSEFRKLGITDKELEATRMAFFAGANAFYVCVMNLFDEDREPTAKDLQVMAGLHNELEEHKRKYNVRTL